jgi:hypothetical protein
MGLPGARTALGRATEAEMRVAGATPVPLGEIAAAAAGPAVLGGAVAGGVAAAVAGVEKLEERDRKRKRQGQP